MNKPKRLASMLALLVAFIMLFSVAYIVLEAEHNCCGEDCAICAQIRACEGLLRNLLTIAVLSAAGRCCFALIHDFADADCCSANSHTLIALKVKLSD